MSIMTSVVVGGKVNSVGETFGIIEETVVCVCGGVLELTCWVVVFKVRDHQVLLQVA